MHGNNGALGSCSFGFVDSYSGVQSYAIDMIHLLLQVDHRDHNSLDCELVLGQQWFTEQEDLCFLLEVILH